MATRFFQESVVSSGKSSIPLKDPDKIREGSGTEISKIFTRGDDEEDDEARYDLASDHSDNSSDN